MKLGNFVEISLGVQEMSKSLPFYERLGFEKVEQSYEPWPWAIMTDGRITLNLAQTTPGAPALAYLAGDMEKRVEQLRDLGVEIMPVYEEQLPEVAAALSAPAGITVTLLKYPARKIPRPSGTSTCKCGTFGELAFPVADLAESIDFWTRLGFRKKGESRLPYPWALISDDLITLGLYQTRDLTKPALIYYSSNTVERIEQMEEEGFEIGEDLPSPDVGTGRTVVPTPDDQIFIMMEYRAEP